jgi:uncharacterized membrane protein
MLDLAHGQSFTPPLEATVDPKVRELAQHLLQTGFDDLSERERHVIHRIANRLRITQNVNTVFEDHLSFGDRLSDRVSAFGGSWPFIILFGLVLLLWIGVNSFLLTHGNAFDPYPYIFLNLLLSMLAAIQAPVIMMSQNRQASKDRMAAAHDYEINLKAELEIMSLHEKMDDLRQQQLTRLLEYQEEQIRLLVALKRPDTSTSENG